MPVRWTVLLLALLPGAASAERPDFLPERPGIGQFPGSPGRGYFMAEGAVELALPSSTPTLSNRAWTLRFGVDETVELRAVVPEVVWGDGLEVGPAALGVKLGGWVSERLGLSVVPEVLLPLDGSRVGWRAQSTATVELDKVRLWLYLDGRYHQELTAFAGVGGLVRISDGGIYLNGGRAVGGPSMVGGGGFWGVSQRSQVDAGCDVLFVGSSATPLFKVGTSFAF